MPAQRHREENQKLSLPEKPLPRRRAVPAQQPQGRRAQLCTEEGLTCQAQGQGRYSGLWCLYSSVCCRSDTQELQPVLLQPRRSGAWLCFTQPCPAVSSQPSSCVGSSSVCAEVTAQLHVWICRHWGCEVPSALAEVVVQGSSFPSAPLKYLNTKALPLVPVLKTMPRYDLALENQKDFQSNVVRIFTVM